MTLLKRGVVLAMLAAGLLTGLQAQAYEQDKNL